MSAQETTDISVITLYGAPVNVQWSLLEFLPYFQKLRASGMSEVTNPTANKIVFQFLDEDEARIYIKLIADIRNKVTPNLEYEFDIICALYRQAHYHQFDQALKLLTEEISGFSYRDGLVEFNKEFALLSNKDLAHNFVSSIVRQSLGDDEVTLPDLDDSFWKFVFEEIAYANVVLAWKAFFVWIPLNDMFKNYIRHYNPKVITGKDIRALFRLDISDDLQEKFQFYLDIALKQLPFGNLIGSNRN